MPLRPLQNPIVTSPAERQGDLLRQALAPEQWPVKPAWLPEDTAVVGGAVRDALLGRLRERPDLDLVVEGDAVSLARRLAGQGGGSCVVLDAERSIARLVSGGWTIDLAQRCGDSLEADLNRRDYSVNAIALPLSGGAPVDPTGGIPDLAAGQLRAISEANLLEDPLRLLRGLRLACELDFAIEAHTRHWLEQHARQLAEVAGERVLAELERLAAAPSGSAGLAQTIATGLLRVWGGDGPEAMARLQHLTPQQALERGLSAAESAWALPLARLAAVLDRAALARLHASRRLQQRCERLRHWHSQLAAAGAGAGLASLPEEERLLLQRQLEEDLPALMLHLEPGEARQALVRWRHPDDPLFHPRPPLDGQRLQQALGLPPGPQLGQLLLHLSQERAFGRLTEAKATAETEAGTVTETVALAAARAWLAAEAPPP
jgi:tRNA nucleotidyltransferase (CCA-adding enzyme)